MIEEKVEYQCGNCGHEEQLTELEEDIILESFGKMQCCCGTIMERKKDEKANANPDTTNSRTRS